MSHKIRFETPEFPGVFQLKKANLSDNACQHFDLPKVGEQNSHQAATTRKEHGKKMCELVATEYGLR
jgi:hypothetical protein